ncbi:MAG: hypothetical protein FJX75_08085 [Armatimonadetes bacterium]|nr:hypothetical protein [Armatimonadota bacterium]
MAATATTCTNYELNLKMCPCTSDCERRGICCECMNFHMHSTQWPRSACMRGTPRPASTLDFPLAIPADCASHPRNLEMCPCTYDTCERRGFCCACVRNHWKEDASSATACMRD